MVTTGLCRTMCPRLFFSRISGPLCIWIVKIILLFFLIFGLINLFFISLILIGNKRYTGCLHFDKFQKPVFKLCQWNVNSLANLVRKENQMKRFIENWKILSSIKFMEISTYLMKFTKKSHGEDSYLYLTPTLQHFLTIWPVEKRKCLWLMSTRRFENLTQTWIFIGEKSPEQISLLQCHSLGNCRVSQINRETVTRR